MSRATFLYCTVLLSVGFCVMVAAAEQVRLVLDESAYCRSYIQFGMDRVSARLLRGEGAKAPGRRAPWGLKRSVKTRWGYLGKAWDAKSWMDDALIGFDGLQYGDRTRAEVYADTDALRRLVVTGLEQAKTRQLVTRHKKIPPYAMSSGWLNARFYTER